MSGPKHSLPLKDETNLKLRTWEVAPSRRQVELVDADDGTVYFGPLPSPALGFSHTAVLKWVIEALNGSIENL
jgi:hypothetical protein